MTKRWAQIAVLVAALSCTALTSSTAAEADSGGIGVGESNSSSNAGVFPVAAPHTYGDGLGAGRGHQGQDLLAKCGKPVVAAEGGVVRYVDYQASGAGNYVVINGPGRSYDYVYMHMLRRPSVARGDRVGAGEQLGLVGSTGHSTACHLHFEMWSAPGWYRGGSVTDPTPFLKRWDHEG